MIRAPKRQDDSVPDEAKEILDLHKGDALEALRTLIAERDAVEERLSFARLAGRMHVRGRRS
ncbi:MAG: hypothetical protein ACT6U0_03905 [Shinella sp.]|uniref:hypothetical protein n=1 Tax=Shinella sp. TaxID=1870904 RepID=UPI004035D9E0